MCWQVEQDVPGGARDLHVVRVFVEQQVAAKLESTNRPDVVEDAGLVVSEIVTNTVGSDSERVHVALRLHHGALRIEVTDRDAGWPVHRAGPGRVYGRGLVLVDALAARWGVDRVCGGGRQVWAMLPVPHELTSSLQCDLRPALPA